MKPLLCLAITLSLFQQPTSTADLKDHIKPFRNNKRFSVKYDKFSDFTLVAVGPFFVSGTKAYVWSSFKLRLTAAFGFTGKDKRPDHFYLAFQTQSRNWEFLKRQTLYLLIDGERYEFQDGEHDVDLRYRFLSESLVHPIPADVFAKLGNAQSAELKVGKLELKLNNEHLEAFRDLYSLAAK